MKTTTLSTHNFTSFHSSEKPLSNFAIIQLLLLNKNTLHYGSDEESEGDYDYENDEIYVDWDVIGSH